MDHLGYLFAAYSLIFAAIFIYVIFIGRRQTALDGELRDLEAELRRMRETTSALPPDSPVR